MNPDDDPEVQADLELREQRVREHKTARVPTWSKPELVANWPCRVCSKPVGVTREAVDHFELFNRMLSRRGEPLLVSTQIMYCDSCRAEFKRTAPERRRGQIERMRPVIQRLKRSSNPEAEYEAIKQLETWGHPDVPGLVAAIRTRIESKGKSREPKGGV